MSSPVLLTGENIEQADLSLYLESQKFVEACSTIARSLKQTGAVFIRDPRVNASDAVVFLDMMEQYFAQPRERKLLDARPDLFYQVGVTPDGIERPRDNSTIASSLDPSERPRSDPAARQRDPKWRFFWRCGDRPQTTDFPELNAAQVVPEAFTEQWRPTMDAWGTKLLECLRTVAEMLAIGLGLPASALSEKMTHGPHLLAPTGTDLSVIGDAVGTTIAGYHYDLNLLSIHGRSSYPGLFVWTRAGRRIPVVVPEGYLLVQSGAQLEHLTAGCIERGMHEVVVSAETAHAVEEARKKKKCLWRVSSTFFGHVRSDASLYPLGQFANCPEARKYADIRAGDQVAQELRELELAT